MEENIGGLQVTHVSMVSTQLYRLLRDCGNEAYLRRFKAVLIGGSAIPDHLIREGVKRGLPLFKSYGSTELASQVTTTHPNNPLEKLFTSGKLLDYRGMQIAEDGEILLKGETLFRGYVEENRIVKAVDEKGWFHSLLPMLDRTSGKRSTLSEEAKTPGGILKKGPIALIPPTRMYHQPLVLIQGLTESPLLIQSWSIKSDVEGGIVRAVIGGFLYRRSMLPDFYGKYVFGDWSISNQADGTLFIAIPSSKDGVLWPFGEILVANNEDNRLGEFVRAFGQDTNRELYVFTSENIGPSGETGKVYRIVPSSGSIPFINVFNQTVFPSDEVKVAAAAYDGPGWIVIHDLNMNIIGKAPLEAGINLDISIDLIRDAEDREELLAMLHMDSNIIGTFEFPGADGPVTGDRGIIVERAFTVNYCINPVVPDVVGMTLEEAEDEITSCNLEVGNIEQDYSNTFILIRDHFNRAYFQERFQHIGSSPMFYNAAIDYFFYVYACNFYFFARWFNSKPITLMSPACCNTSNYPITLSDLLLNR